MKKLLTVFISFLFFIQVSAKDNDSLTVARIKQEAYSNSKSDETIEYLCESIGPRLMWSPQYRQAAEWIVSKMKEWNITETKFEEFASTGRSWSIKNFHATVTKPYSYSLTAYPKVCSPPTNGTIRGQVVYLDARTEEDLDKYKGRLKDKIVLIYDQVNARPYTDAMITRLTDSALAVLSNKKLMSEAERNEKKKGEDEYNERILKYFNFIEKKVEFCKNEGAALVIDHGYKLYGIIQVWGSISPVKSKDIFDFLINNAFNPELPATVPQITISTEEYNGLIRALKLGNDIEMEVNIDVNEGEPQKGFNVIAEIPGTDLSDEVVIIGAHLDSYHTSKGVTDNGTGVVTCMEALRLIKSLGLQPRRTIRAGLWGAEEQGLLGSKAHIKYHFEERGDEKCYAYFNMDFGCGRFRGLYAMENEGAAGLFRDWFRIINDSAFQTVCLDKTPNSDHEAFDDAGLNGFPFIQDGLDYFKIYHTNMDVIERIPKDELKHTAYVMAAVAWLAANREGEFPKRTMSPAN